jgi:hypothetical protein
MLPNDLIVLRNEGEDQQGRGEGLGGVEDQLVLKRTLMSHTESDLDVLYMDRKIISRSFQWN